MVLVNFWRYPDPYQWFSDTDPDPDQDPDPDPTKWYGSIRIRIRIRNTAKNYSEIIVKLNDIIIQLHYLRYAFSKHFDDEPPIRPKLAEARKVIEGTGVKWDPYLSSKVESKSSRIYT